MANKQKRHPFPAFIKKCIKLAGEGWRFAFFALLVLGARLTFISDTLPITSIAGYLPPDAPGLYPKALAAVLKVFSLDITSKAFVWLNLAFDLCTVTLLGRIGVRFFGPISALGLMIAALSPLWIGHVTLPTSHCLALLLFVFFLERWTDPDRDSRAEAIAGLALGLLSLAESWLYLFPLLPFLIEFKREAKGKRGKRRLPLAFLALALLLPLPWLLQAGAPLQWPPVFSRLADLWYAGWLRPLPGVYVPDYFGAIYFWVFLGFASVLGAVGYFTAREESTSQMNPLLIGTAAYLSGASLLAPIHSHFSLLLLVVLALGAGDPLERIALASKGRASA